MNIIQHTLVLYFYFISRYIQHILVILVFFKIDNIVFNVNVKYYTGLNKSRKQSKDPYYIYVININLGRKYKSVYL